MVEREIERSKGSTEMFSGLTLATEGYTVSPPSLAPVNGLYMLERVKISSPVQKTSGFEVAVYMRTRKTGSQSAFRNSACHSALSVNTG